MNRSADWLRQVQAWAKEQVCRVASLERVAVFGSFGRGTAGVGSDLDLLLIDAAASGPQHERLRRWPLERLPLSCDALVLTPGEHAELLEAQWRFSRELEQDAVWVWARLVKGAAAKAV